MTHRKNELPKEENKERISLKAGGNDDFLDLDYQASGGSVNEHRRLESANAHIAEKEIKQSFNNS